MGFFWSAIAGAAMSVQGVMNARLGERVGLLEASAFVQGTAFALSAIIAAVFGSGDIAKLQSAPKGYMLGGALGVVITVTVMLSLKGLPATVAISIILISQLLVAAALDALGLMGQEKTVFGLKQYIGLALMLGGVAVFKLTG